MALVGVVLTVLVFFLGAALVRTHRLRRSARVPTDSAFALPR